MSLLWWLFACDGFVDVPCEARIDDTIATLPHVAWSTRRPGASHVDYTFDDVTLSTPIVDDGSLDHAASLYGVPSLTDVAITALTDTGTRLYRCETTLRTRNLPASLPSLELVADEPDARADGRYYVGSLFTLSGAPQPQFVIDRQGEYLWYRASTAEVSPMTTFARDGHLRYNALPPGQPSGGVIRHATLDGVVLDELADDGLHHVFAELDDGTIAYLAKDVRETTIGDRPPEDVVGDLLRERRPDGTAVTVFSVWDHLTPTDAVYTNYDVFPEGLDWTHGNAVSYVPDADHWLTSFAFVRTIVEVDRATGDVVRSFHGGPSHLSDGSGMPVAEGRAFYHQHDPHFLDDGNLLLFGSDPISGFGGATEYRVDEDLGGLVEVWSAGYDSLWSPIYGQATRLPNGNTLVNFAGAGVLREYTPDGGVAFELHAPLGWAFGQVYAVDDLYPGP